MTGVCLRRDPSPGNGDRGSAVLGWLVKLALGMALVGIVLFDAIAVGVTRVGAGDASRLAADAGQTIFLSDQNVAAARTAATKAAAGVGATLVDFAVAPDGTTTVTVTKPVDTLVLYRLSFTRGLTVARATTEQKPPST